MPGPGGAKGAGGGRVRCKKEPGEVEEKAGGGKGASKGARAGPDKGAQQAPALGGEKSEGKSSSSVSCGGEVLHSDTLEHKNVVNWRNTRILFIYRYFQSQERETALCLGGELASYDEVKVGKIL